MSLVKKPEMTERNRTAHRANGRQSRGSTTPEGKERARAANLRHGYHSNIRDEAIEALGEDPERLRRLIDAAYEEWRPQSDYQAALVERIARLQWRMDRAERLQESLAVARVEHLAELRTGRALKIHHHYGDLEMVLGLLVVNSARPDFYAYPQMVCDFTQKFGNEVGEDTQRVLELLARLRKPREFSPHSRPLEGEITDDADWLAGLPQEGEEEDYPDSLPDLPVAEGAERDPLRQELHDRAAAMLSETKQAWEPTLAKFHVEPTSLERDTMWKEAQQERALMLREEATCFRQFWRLTTILMKLQERRQELGLGGQDTESTLQDSSVGGGPPQQGAAGSAASTSKRARKSASASAQIKNAGASGDVDENTRAENRQGVADAPTEGTKRPVTVNRQPKR